MQLSKEQLHFLLLLIRWQLMIHFIINSQKKLNCLLWLLS